MIVEEVGRFRAADVGGSGGGGGVVIGKTASALALRRVG